MLPQGKHLHFSVNVGKKNPTLLLFAQVTEGQIFSCIILLFPTSPGVKYTPRAEGLRNALFKTPNMGA